MMQGEEFESKLKKKSHFNVKKRIILRHAISHDKIKVDKAKINLIVNLSTPTYVTEVGSFLGYAGLYRRFIQDFNQIAKPFTNLLTKDVAFLLS